MYLLVGYLFLLNVLNLHVLNAIRNTMMNKIWNALSPFLTVYLGREYANK